MSEVIVGDALTVLAGLEATSVQCCITSPPYFGLRDYGTGEWEGGDGACDHLMPVSYKSSTLGASTGGRSEATHARSIGAQATPYARKCGKCAAIRVDKQLGLEATPDDYVAKLVAVFAEVKRVLRDDGTLWLNLGDSYAGSGVKGKDLLGIPWMVAFALRADGWYLRSEIIWAKPNPMPESVTDRPTKAHEQVFLLSKSPRYHYEYVAIREAGEGRLDRWPGSEGRGPQGWRGEALSVSVGRNKRSVWTVATAPYPEAHFATFPPKLIEPMVLAGCPRDGLVLDPFAGSGTTLQVAIAHGRRAVGIELNPEYAQLARNRLAGVTPSMFDVTASPDPESEKPTAQGHTNGDCLPDCVFCSSSPVVGLSPSGPRERKG